MSSDKLVYSRYLTPSENSVELSLGHLWPVNQRHLWNSAQLNYIIKNSCGYNYRNINDGTASIRRNTSETYTKMAC